MGRPPVCAKGFTLLELLIVLVLAAIFLSLATPSFSEFRRNALLSGAANDFLGSVQLGRTEAIKRQERVSLCPVTDLENPTCEAGTSFTAWAVFADADGNCEPDSATDILRVAGIKDSAARDPVVAESDGPCVAFSPTGYRTATVSATHVIFCDARGTRPLGDSSLSAARGVEIAVTGRGQVIRNVATLEEWGTACS